MLTLRRLGYNSETALGQVLDSFETTLGPHCIVSTTEYRTTLVCLLLTIVGAYPRQEGSGQQCKQCEHCISSLCGSTIPQPPSLREFLDQSLHLGESMEESLEELEVE